MKITKYQYNQTFDLGEWSISKDIRHNCYDITRGNTHRYCTTFLADAVRFVLIQQGWSNIAVSAAAVSMAAEMAAEMEAKETIL